MNSPGNDLPPIPGHVPPDLVLPFELGSQMRTLEDPYATLIPRIQRGPEIFFAVNLPPSGQSAWILCRAKDMRSVYADTTNFSRHGHGGFAAAIGETWDSIPSELNPPRHGAFRAVLNPLFQANRLAKFEDRVRHRARELVSRLRIRGECDFVVDFAQPFPVSIFLEVMGLAQDNVAQLLAWEHDLLHTSDRIRRAAAVRSVKNLLLAAIEDHRRHPRSDLIGMAIEAQVEGRPFSELEVLGLCFNLYVGGLDTVTSNLGLHYYHLAGRPDHQAILRRNASAIPAALEELLRAYAAVTTFRTCSREIQLRGVTVKPGDRVALSTPLGGRDPFEYDSPDEVLLDRGKRHLSFGNGAHFCLGAQLARRELYIAMEEFLSAVPDFRIVPGTKIPFFLGPVIHVESLPLEWDH